MEQWGPGFSPTNSSSFRGAQTTNLTMSYPAQQKPSIWCLRGPSPVPHLRSALTSPMGSSPFLCRLCLCSSGTPFSTDILPARQGPVSSASLHCSQTCSPPGLGLGQVERVWVLIFAQFRCRIQP